MAECALDREATRQGLDRYQGQAVRGTAGGAALVGLGLVFLLLPVGASWATDLAAGLGVAGLIALGVSLGALRNAGRMRRALAAGPWSAHAAVAVVRGGMVPPSIVLGDPHGGRAWPFALAATKQRYERVLPGPDAVLWWCGDPDRGGVIAPPGGGEPIWARPIRGHHTRNRTIGLAATEGLFTRPTPAQPGGGGVRLLEGGDAAGPEAGPAARPEDRPQTGPDPRPGARPDADSGARPGPRDLHPLTYAVLGAAARRQALPGGGRVRREADVRVVPWWRVRSLRRVSGLPRLLVSPVPVVTGALMLGGAGDYPAVVAYAVLALGVGAVLYSGRTFFTTGRTWARALARAARAAGPVPRRYVLLFDPVGGAPVLVLFPHGGGPEDLPEAVLRLYPPGTPKDPRRGLPSEPAGPLELRGGLDRAEGGAPVAVPWIEGRPLWPAGPYEELRADAPGARAYLERLAPPQEGSAVPAP